MGESAVKPSYTKSLRALKSDTILAALIATHGKPDLTRYHQATPSIFEALLRSIVYQQLSGNAARAIHGRILELFPKGKPKPELLLKIPAKKLRAAGLSIQKIEYVRDLARKSLDGSIDSKRLPKMSSQEIIEHLVAVKGVGEWTAHMILIFTLNRLDILPTGDLGIKKGFQIAYKLKKLPSKKEMEKIAAPWKGHESVASWYLWRVADGDKR
ncbi:MAG: DNA-3-methyladenine glycosylase 2 family protein [Candidatus Pacebacteria bacterium]|nr:DNA-3-methyladenine glycosylase 2 family protein [Candidatus Paceibacterota bacterium]